MSGCKDDFLVKGVWRVVGPYKVVSFVLMAVWDKIPTILHLISKGKKSLIGVACARETRKMLAILFFFFIVKAHELWSFCFAF